MDKLLLWYAEEARDLPWRRTSDPYAIWVSEIMLQQTQVQTVIPYWERWMKALPDIDSLARVRTERLLKLWEGLGYYRRAHNMQRAAREIRSRFSGAFPRTLPSVLSLPGIGRYTGGAICSIAFNQPTPILDGNVIRVLSRLYEITDPVDATSTRDALWLLAERLVRRAASPPEGNRDTVPRCSHLNQALMELGALICTPRQPACARCPLKSVCRARRHGRAESLPSLEKKTATQFKRVVAFVLVREGRFLVRQRAAREVNGHLWEFPNLEGPLSDWPRQGHWSEGDLRQLARKNWKVTINDVIPLATIRHAITSTRIVLEAFTCQLTRDLKKEKTNDWTWRTRQSLDRLAFTAAHRKLVTALDQRPLTSR